MIKKCDPDIVFLYSLDDNNHFCIPTLGVYPRIIDFGFSYICDLDEGPLWPSMAHTDVGFMSDRFDWVADPKLFLVSTVFDMMKYRKSKNVKKLNVIVKNLFKPLKIDMESGWDDMNTKGASDLVMDLLDECEEQYDSCIFNTYGEYAIDLIESLIVLPIEKQPYSNIHQVYRIWLHEWKKIEGQISSPFYLLYVLQRIIDAARLVRPDYINNKTRSRAISTFKRLLYDVLSSVSKYCHPRRLEAETMLCSLLMLGKCIEGVLFDIINNLMGKKGRDYKKMPLKNTIQIFAAIQTNLPDTYIFSKDTVVIHFDAVNKSTNVIRNISNDVTTKINTLHPMCRGKELYLLDKDIAK
jgi:hypothetical protein